MAKGVNKVILVGTLGTDPELKQLANGNSVVNISLATSETWNDKNTGQKQERTDTMTHHSLTQFFIEET